MTQRVCATEGKVTVKSLSKEWVVLRVTVVEDSTNITV